MNPPRVAVFPGTFDPFTNGHLDLTRRAARLFDRVVVAVAHSPVKGTAFPVEDRVEMIRMATRSLRRVEVVDFADLVVDCARRLGAHVMIRGLRAVSDFEFEFQMALMNRRLSPSIEVAFLMPSQQYTYLNSTLVKEVVRLGGAVHGLVPRGVEEYLRARYPGVARKGVGTKSAPGAAANAGRSDSRPVTKGARRSRDNARPAARRARGSR